MKRKPRGDDSNADGVRVVYEKRTALRRGLPLILVALTGSAAALLLFTGTDRPSPLRPTSVPEGASAKEPARAQAARPIHARPTPMPQPFTVRRVPAGVAARPTAHERDAASEHDEAPLDLHAGEYIEALRDEGETAGLAAFPPPGTRPPRSGIIVPADYVLPEGFARHYQSTDDGQRLEPILALAPGYELLDDAGDPVPLIDKRIVPPEFAPPDLPVRVLEIPSGSR